MNKQMSYIIIVGTVVILLVAGVLIIPAGHPTIEKYNNTNRAPKIYPDYTGIVIPPNIAPLNFMINEKGEQFYVRIIPAVGDPIEISSSDSRIVIKDSKWKNMLSLNKGKKIQVEVFVKDGKEEWNKYQTITNSIAVENIDNHLAYRLLHPAHNYWVELGIYQRNLENFDEDPILLNRLTGDNCMNCHSFSNNDPNYMMLHMRTGKAGGTLINRAGKIIKVDTKTSFNKAGSYPAWHPNRKLIAYAVNNLLQFFHAVGESRDVLDRSSDLILYSIDENTVTSCPEISDPERMENFPAWSPDGKYLYFCSSPKLENFESVKEGEEELLYNQIQYDLMRIPYDVDSKMWGKLETVLPATKLGKSLTEPRISPDGKYLLFTVADYGNFPIYLKSSDVYLLDLTTGNYFKPDINSDRTDSFHSWSSNSRWFVFSSKRGDGVLARPYFSYFDVNGIAHKPFVMPQEDPGFYTTFLKTFNVPELIKGPVTVKMQDLLEAAYDSVNALKAKLDPTIQDRKTKSSPEGMWRPAKR
jgi:hypothetical protein